MSVSSNSTSNDGGDLSSRLKMFLHERLQLRLESQKDEDKRALLIERFKYENWFEYAAGKVCRLRAATHVAKYSHSSVKKAADLYVIPDFHGKEGLVGTHLFSASRLVNDLAAPGGAADLDSDIKEFLRIKYGEGTVFDGLLAHDIQLLNALSDSPSKANNLMHRLAQITEPLNGSNAHTLVKQLYWLVGDAPEDDGDFHLLAPLYATSLAHRVFQTVNEDRFGESAKVARKARRAKKPSASGYHDYPQLAVQKIGGANQQNVSQLNSERGGQNYLLASLPPNWVSRDVSVPLRTESVIPRFARRAPVRQQVNELVRLLGSDPSSTMSTRDLRDDLTAALVDELMLFTFEMHRLPAGWSAQAECRLVVTEQFWLDPGRADEDADFARAREASGWHEAVGQRFANWLNDELNRRTKASFGDTEQAHWAERVDGVMAHFRTQLNALQDVLRDDDEGEVQA